MERPENYEYQYRNLTAAVTEQERKMHCKKRFSSILKYRISIRFNSIGSSSKNHQRHFFLKYFYCRKRVLKNPLLLSFNLLQELKPSL